ncbi:MAG: hypothetical protein WC809_18765 [Sinimarinibacterium sp.]|jgi:hypothetical protein
MRQARTFRRRQARAIAWAYAMARKLAANDLARFEARDRTRRLLGEVPSGADAMTVAE